MHRYLTLLLVVSSVLAIGLCVQGGVPLAFGFGVTAPVAVPIDWSESFSSISTEILTDPNLTFLFTLGTYPSHFPNLFEGSVDLIVKSWMGAAAIYAGGGLSLQWKPIGGIWGWTPYMRVTAGTQIWLIDSVALIASVRSLDTLPPTWTFSPEASLGLQFSLSPPRPPTLGRENAFYLWIVVGLLVAALLTYYPHS
ncbi:MAG: hypothetical protein U9Q94_06030 [Candidatus Bipolaricaulota bacterium]|nr:hypothetical protein [Candidatus Bipolaricaulota bacterium]